MIYPSWVMLDNGTMVFIDDYGDRKRHDMRTQEQKDYDDAMKELDEFLKECSTMRGDL